LRCKQLLDDLKEKRRYGNLKEKPLERTVWRSSFGSGYWLPARQTMQWWWWWWKYHEANERNPTVGLTTFEVPRFCLVLYSTLAPY